MTTVFDRKSKYGIFAYIILIIVAILLWSIEALAPDSTIDNRRAEIIGSLALITMSYMLILTTRFTKLEDYFGGMDRLFKVHKNLGIIALALIIFHNIITPEGKDPGPNIAKILGIIALIGFVILILLTIIPILRKYERWLISHRIMGVFFAIVTVHLFIAPKSITQSSLIGIYLKLIAITGIIAYIYKVILYKQLKKHYNFTVSNVEKLGSKIINITLTAKTENFNFIPGQYVYISFKSDGIKKETHPFTISGPAENGFTLTIKASGDYTKSLYENLKENDNAIVDAPYGRFSYKEGTKQQVWIAGGIGITPFLSWVRSLNENNKDIHLIHCVKDQEDAIFKDEIKNKENNSFKFSLYESKKNGHLNLEKLNELNVNIDSNTTVYMCGPKAMTKNMKKEIKKTKINNSLILFEEFSIK